MNQKRVLADDLMIFYEKNLWAFYRIEKYIISILDRLRLLLKMI